MVTMVKVDGAKPNYCIALYNVEQTGTMLKL